MELSTRKRAKFARIPLAITAGLLALTLGGCYERGGLGPASLSLVGTSVVVAVCGDFEVNQIYGEYRANGDWRPFIDLKGLTELDSGAQIVLGHPVPGMEGSSEAFDVGTADAVSIKFEGDGAERVSFNATFSGAVGLGLSDGEWLQTDGRVTSERCE